MQGITEHFDSFPFLKFDKCLINALMFDFVYHIALNLREGIF